MPAKEDTKVAPLFKVMDYKNQVEQAFRHMEGLNHVTLRMAVPYGKYDTTFFGKFSTVARIFKERRETLRLLGSPDRKLNTVWVYDVARALIHAAEWRSKQGPLKAGDPVVFNIVDHNKSTKQTISNGLSRCFDMTVDFFFVSNLVAKTINFDPKQALAEINHMTLMNWSEMVSKSPISHTPLTPYLEEELLGDTVINIDGSLFEELTGFTYLRPQVPDDFINELVESYKEVNWWP